MNENTIYLYHDNSNFAREALFNSYRIVYLHFRLRMFIHFLTIRFDMINVQTKHNEILYFNEKE